MIAAILCSGPSLARTWPVRQPISGLPYSPQEPHLVLAVNRAVEHAACDWWVGNDANTFTDYTPVKVRRGACTWRSSFDEHKHGALRGLAFLDSGELPDIGVAYRHSSMLVAMLAAVTLGADHVAIYGCDWDGILDFTGTHDGSIRDDARWAGERASFNQVCAAINHVSFTRVFA